MKLIIKLLDFLDIDELWILKEACEAKLYKDTETIEMDFSKPSRIVDNEITGNWGGRT